jgi:2'-5' RNA ligase
MKYFLGCLICKDVEEFQQKIIRELHEKFKIDYLYEHKQPSHLTLKAPFTCNAEQLKELEHLLENFCKLQEKVKIKIKDVGNFRRRIIFMDVIVPEIVQKEVQKLGKALRNLGWLNWWGQELSELEKEKKFHLTLAKGDYAITKKFGEISSFLKEKYPKIEFECDFDNITIFSKDSGEKNWKIFKQFNFNK